jgi:hypothetical protein
LEQLRANDRHLFTGGRGVKLLTKAGLVVALGAASLLAPEPAAAAVDSCVVIEAGACQGDFETLCTAYCGEYDSGRAFCVDHPLNQADTLNSTRDIE